MGQRVMITDGLHMLRYIEWVEHCRFWKKGMILFQIYIDNDNWLTKNLIRRYLSSLNNVAIGTQSKISYLHPSPVRSTRISRAQTNSTIVFS